MAADLAIDNFAFDLFRSFWEVNGMFGVLNEGFGYPDATEYPEEVFKAVYTIHLLSESFYRVLDDEYDKFSTSLSDFHSYFISRCRLIDMKCCSVMDKVLASAALMLAIGLHCFSKNNLIFIHSCPMSWAMYFDWELKDEFYEQGGWIKLQNYSSGFQNTLAFVLSFESKLDIWVRLLEYFEFCAPKLMPIFDEEVANLWRQCTNALMTGLRAMINHKPQFDSNFQDLVLFPGFLNAVCNLTEFNFLSCVIEKKLSHCPNDMINLKLDVLETYLKEKRNGSCNPIQDSKSNETDRNKSGSFELYREHIDEQTSPINDIGKGTEHRTCSTNEIVGLKGKIHKENRKSEEAAHSYSAFWNQTESPDDFSVEPSFKSESQKHPIASSPNSPECTKTNVEEMCNEGNSKQIRSPSSNQSVHRNITEAKALSKGKKKYKGKKKKSLQKSQDDLDIVLQNVLVLGVP